MYRNDTIELDIATYSNLTKAQFEALLQEVMEKYGEFWPDWRAESQRYNVIMTMLSV